MSQKICESAGNSKSFTVNSLITTYFASSLRIAISSSVGLLVFRDLRWESLSSLEESESLCRDFFCFLLGDL